MRQCTWIMHVSKAYHYNWNVQQCLFNEPTLSPWQAARFYRAYASCVTVATCWLNNAWSKDAFKRSTDLPVWDALFPWAHDSHFLQGRIEASLLTLINQSPRIWGICIYMGSGCTIVVPRSSNDQEQGFPNWGLNFVALVCKQISNMLKQRSS